MAAKKKSTKKKARRKAPTKGTETAPELPPVVERVWRVLTAPDGSQVRARVPVYGTYDPRRDGPTARRKKRKPSVRGRRK